MNLLKVLTKIVKIITVLPIVLDGVEYLIRKVNQAREAL